MTRLPENPPLWVRPYVGLEFADRGRDPERGVDCWGLLRLVYSQRLGVYLPGFENRYHGTTAGDAPVIAAIIRDELRAGTWINVGDAPSVGDVALFRICGDDGHVGVVVARGRFLHAWRGTRSAVERWDTGAWAPRLAGFFRYAGPVRIAGRPRVLSDAGVDAVLPAGGSVVDLLAAANIRATPFLRVYLGDREVPRGAWAHVRPKPGRVLSVVAVAAGGGGQDGGKTAMRMVFTIAIIALAAWAGPAAFPAAAAKAALLSAGIGLVGTLLINALIPPPKPDLSDEKKSSPSINGVRNELRPYQVIPQPLGEHRMVPPFGAAPYTEIVGDDQYLRCVFVLGKGPLAISDLRIGETDLNEYEGVEVETREGRAGDAPLVIYPGTVLEQTPGIEIKQADGWVVRTADPDAEELSIDITLPAGLAELLPTGARRNRSVALEVEYSVTGEATWVPVNSAPPDFSRGLDYMFRRPENIPRRWAYHYGRIAWGAGMPDARPDYLPADGGWAWQGAGYVYAATAGTYHFAIDCSDAGDVQVDDRPVVSWYGEHAAIGGPDFTAHTGSIALSHGWHQIRVRVQSNIGSTTGALALGWKKPGDAVFSIIPGMSLSIGAGGSGQGGVRFSYYDNSIYTATLAVTAKRVGSPIRRSLAWAVPRGQYDVRIRRVTPDAPEGSTTIIDTTTWSALRAIRAQDPIAISRVAKVALRIKATDQLNGVLDNFNCVVKSILPDWDTATQTWIERATSSPAACYRAVLQGPAIATPIADGRLDLAEIQAWADETAARGLSFNGIFDTKGTVFERLKSICAAGRADFGQRDGKLSVVRDRIQTAPVQVFTPRNSFDFRGRKAFARLPHGFRVQFLDRENGYTRRERLVLADGYQVGGKDAFGNAAPLLPAATEFETLEVFGVTSGGEAWKHGRYHLAVGRLRPEVFEWGADCEHLACSRGDLVLLNHDVILVGLGYGRVVDLVLDQAGNLVGLRLDEELTMDDGDAYGLVARLAGGATFSAAVVTVPGVSTTVTLANPVAPSSPWPEAGDLFSFGRFGQETLEVLIKGIEHDRDLAARIVAIPYSPGVHLADAGTIPPYDPGISLPPSYDDGPETPVIESIRSDDRVMVIGADGTLRPRMLITLRAQGGLRPISTEAMVRTRERPDAPAEPDGPWTSHPRTSIDGNQVSVFDVEEGVTYQIRLRTLTPIGQVSAWVSAEHTIIGRIAPPPDVEAFDVVRLSDGVRRYAWSIGDAPPDLAGVLIRYGPPGGAWDSLQPLHDQVLQSSPSDINGPTAGSWAFGIKAIDTSGNVSVNALIIERTLGPESLEGVAFSDDCAFAGWPGQKDGCHLTEDRLLEADGLTTWDGLGGSAVGSWDNYPRWNLQPVTPIAYTHTLDAGILLDFSPDATGAALGVLTLEASWSGDGVIYTDFVPLAVARAVTITARYLRIRATVGISPTEHVPILQRLLVMMRAIPAQHEHQDLDTAGLDATWRVGPGDIRLPVPAALFRVVRHVSLSFNGMGPGWSWELIDRSSEEALEFGPRVRIYDADHEPADAVIDAVIRGFGALAGGAVAGRLEFDDEEQSAWIGAV